MLFFRQSFTSDELESFDGQDTVALRESEKKLNQLLQHRLSSMKTSQKINFVAPNVEERKNNMDESKTQTSQSEEAAKFQTTYEDALEEMMSSVYESTRLDPGKKRVGRIAENKVTTSSSDGNHKNNNEQISDKKTDSDETCSGKGVAPLLDRSSKVDNVVESSHSKQLHVDSKPMFDSISDNEYSDLEGGDEKLLEICWKNASEGGLKNNTLSLPSFDAEIIQEKDLESSKSVNSSEDPLKLSKKETSTINSSTIFIKASDRLKHVIDNQRLPQDSDCNKSGQSLRSKLSDQINTIHKVGAPSGGSLRGLKQNINHDKLMPPSRLASLKPGTLFDLNNDKPQRPTFKRKPIPTAQNTLSGKTNAINASDIISKLSENDLKKLITKHIGKLPTPPNLQLINSSISSSIKHNSSLSSPFITNHTNQQFPTWESNGSQDTNFQASNIKITNTTTIDYSDRINCANSKVIEDSESFWPSSTYNQCWRRDPRRVGAQNMSTSNLAYPSNEVFEKPTYSTNATESQKNNAVQVRGSLVNSIYNPPDLHIDPLKSPCYDGSSTPNAFAINSYNTNMENQVIQQMNTDIETSKSQAVMPVSTNPPVNYDNVYGEQQPNIFQRPSLMGTPSMYNYSSAIQMQSPMSPYGANQDIRFQNYPGHPQVRQNYPRYSSSQSYREWKAEQNQEARTYSQTSYYDRQAGNRNNYQNNYAWSQNTVSQLSDSNRDTANRYLRHDSTRQEITQNDTSKKQEIPKTHNILNKMSKRDPRRRSLEESMEKKEKVNSDNSAQVETIKSSSHDHRARTRSPSRDKNRFRAVRSLDRRRYPSNSSDRSSNHRKPKSCDKDSLQHKHDKYTHLYQTKLHSDTISQKTGLCNIKSFKIPKINRDTNEILSCKTNVKDLSLNKSTGCKVSNSSIKQKNVPTIEERQKNRDNVQLSEDDLTETRDFDNESKSTCNEITVNEINMTKPSEISVDNIIGEGSQMTSTVKSKDKVIEPKEESVSNDEGSCVNVDQNSPYRRSLRLNKLEKTKDLSGKASKREKHPAKQTEIKDDGTSIEDTLNEIDKVSDKNINQPESNIDCQQDSFIRRVGIELEIKNKTSEPEKDFPELKTTDISKESILNPSKTIKESQNFESRTEIADIPPLSSTKPLDEELEIGSELNTEDLSKKSTSVVCSLSSIDAKLVDTNSKETAKQLISSPGVSSDVILKERDTKETKKNNITDCAIDLSIKKRSNTSVVLNETVAVTELINVNQKPETVTHTTHKNCKVGDSLDISDIKSNAKITADCKETHKIIKNRITPQQLQDLLGVVISADKLQKVADILAAEENVSSSDLENLDEKNKSLVQSSTEKSKNNTENVDQDNISNLDSNGDTLATDNDNQMDPHENISVNNSISIKRKGVKKTYKRKVIWKKKKKTNTKPKLYKKNDNPEPKTRKPTKKKNELDRLQDDISKYHDSEAIATASGLRLCRLNKEKPILPSSTINSVSKRNTADKCVKAKEISLSDNNTEYSSDSNSDFDAPMAKLAEKFKNKYRPVVSENLNQKLISEQSVIDKKPEINKPGSNATFTIKSVENKNNENLKSLNSYTMPSLNFIEGGPLNENLANNLKLNDTTQSLTCKPKITCNSIQEKLPSETCCEITSEQSNADTDNKEGIEPVSISKSKPGRKSLSRNILSKYGIKKRKKNYWSVGIIQKSKSKKQTKIIPLGNPDSLEKMTNNDELSEKNVTSSADCTLLVATDSNETPNDAFDNIQKEGCFDYSDESYDHSRIVTDVSNSYKELSDAAVMSISALSNKNHNRDVVDKLYAKLSSGQESDESLTDIQHLIGKKKSSSTSPSLEMTITNEASSQSQCLLEEGIKTVNSCSEELDSDSEIGTFATKLFHDIDSSDNDALDNELLSEGDLDIVKPPDKNTPLLFENQVDRCKALLNTQQSFEPKAEIYETSLPVGSNFSEFTHIMRKLKTCEMRQAEQRSTCVGGLEALSAECGISFLCTVKIFNRNCEFQTTLLEKLGQHVNETHHNSWWDGTCRECFVFFKQDLLSHDKASIYTQSRAFCHLVRKHVPFVTKQNEEIGSSTLKEGK